MTPEGKPPIRPSTRYAEVIGEIVTYDIIRRKGFIRVLTPCPVSRIPFRREHLPDSVLDQADALAPELHPSRRKKLTTDQFHEATARVGKFLRSCWLRFDAEVRPDGSLRILPRTMQAVEKPAAAPDRSRGAN